MGQLISGTEVLVRVNYVFNFAFTMIWVFHNQGSFKMEKTDSYAHCIYMQSACHVEKNKLFKFCEC